MFNKVKSLLFKLNAAELSIATFVIASLIGAFALVITEKDTTFIKYYPVTEFVTVKPEVTEPSPDLHLYELREEHVFLREEETKGISFLDAWFTSVSALCVTGLTSIDFSEFTSLGQFVVMLLIQAGGLGIIVFTSIFALAIFRGLSERIALRNLMSSVLNSHSQDVWDMLKYVAFYTFAFEFLATIIMGIHLQFFADPELINNANPWWWALFHSVSAFNNAGFGLNSNNLVNFLHDPVINTVIASLIILGGLGYPVLIFISIWFREKILGRHNGTEKELKKDLSGVASLVQVKVALIGTFLLIALGTLLPLIVEIDNPILDGLSVPEKIMASVFQSVSTRTAGFNTIDIGGLHIATIFLYIGLMFVGANPAGTAGGIKIPTMAVLYGYIKDWFRQPGLPVTVLGRRISKFAVSHAIRLFFFSIIYIVVVVYLITTIEHDYLITPDPLFNFTKVLFEVVSAFGTVGLSMGFRDGVSSFSTILSDASKVLIIITMLFGRLGPLTILESLPGRKTATKSPLSPDFENSDQIQIG